MEGHVERDAGPGAEVDPEGGGGVEVLHRVLDAVALDPAHDVRHAAPEEVVALALLVVGPEPRVPQDGVRVGEQQQHQPALPQLVGVVLHAAQEQQHRRRPQQVQQRHREKEWRAEQAREAAAQEQRCEERPPVREQPAVLRHAPARRRRRRRRRRGAFPHSSLALRRRGGLRVRPVLLAACAVPELHAEVCRPLEADGGEAGGGAEGVEGGEGGEEEGGEAEEGAAPVAEVEATGGGADEGARAVLLVAEDEEGVDGHAEPQRAGLDPAGGGSGRSAAIAMTSQTPAIINYSMIT